MGNNVYCYMIKGFIKKLIFGLGFEVRGRLFQVGKRIQSYEYIEMVGE